VAPVEGEALGPAKGGLPVQRNVGGGYKGWLIGEKSLWWRENGRVIMDRKPGKGITFEM